MMIKLSIVEDPFNMRAEFNLLGSNIKAHCKRHDCNLPVYANGLCEPCWEIGRDELDIEVELEEP